MSEPKRCDVCRIKADLKPQSLYDVLCYLAPPLELLAALERWQKVKQLPQPVVEYLERWQKLQSSDPVPEVDKFGALVQDKLLDAPARNGYGG